MSVTTLCVDARRLYGSGIGRYVRELVPRLMNGGAFAECVLLGDPAELQPWCDAHLPSARVVALPGGRYSLAAQRGWLQLASRLPRSRVVWFPHLDAPLLRMPAPAVVTVHDLIPLRVHGATSPWRRALLPWVLRRVAACATRVICVSDSTAADVTALLPAMAGKVRVVPNGGAEIGAMAVPADVALPAYPFLLCVANRKVHKNLDLAVRVLAALRVTHPSLRLVVVGERFPEWQHTLSLAATLGVGDALIDLGVVSDAMLRALYAQCTALLAPSRMEGFGLPVVEAMACGAPVIAADLPWAHAVGGTAVLYADADNAEEWARHLNRLLHDAPLRTVHSAAGQREASAFTWEHSARLTRDVLFEALGAAPR